MTAPSNRRAAEIAAVAMQRSVSTFVRVRPAEFAGKRDKSVPLQKTWPIGGPLTRNRP
jgi:hypothetical protein